MFNYVGKEGFGQYKCQCGECGFVLTVGTVSFRSKLYEQLSCEHCAKISKKSRDKALEAGAGRRAELEVLRDELFTVAIVSNVVDLK